MNRYPWYIKRRREHYICYSPQVGAGRPIPTIVHPDSMHCIKSLGPYRPPPPRPEKKNHFPTPRIKLIHIKLTFMIRGTRCWFLVPQVKNICGVTGCLILGCRTDTAHKKKTLAPCNTIFNTTTNAP